MSKIHKYTTKSIHVYLDTDDFKPWKAAFPENLITAKKSWQMLYLQWHDISCNDLDQTEPGELFIADLPFEKVPESMLSPWELLVQEALRPELIYLLLEDSMPQLPDIFIHEGWR